MRKFFALLLTFGIILSYAQTALALCDSADCACVINGATGEVIYSKNVAKRHPMASTTKIMTAIVAIENSSPDDIVTVSPNAAAQEGSAMYIEAGMQLTMRDLLYGLMLPSGNDAAVARAEHIAGDCDTFAGMMNDKAREIGARDTNFVNPNGLPNDNHFTTAYDLAAIARYGLQKPLFREVVLCDHYIATPINSPKVMEFGNHNKLLGLYPGTTGVKTGYTDAAGRCFVSSAKRDNMEFIAVTLGDNDDWNDHMEMLDYAFANHHPESVVTTGNVIKVAKINSKSYNFITSGDFVVPFKNSGGNDVEIVTHMAVNIYAPINAGEKVGYADIKYRGEKIGQVDIISQSDIYEEGGISLINSLMNTFSSVIKKILI